MFTSRHKGSSDTILLLNNLYSLLRLSEAPSSSARLTLLLKVMVVLSVGESVRQRGTAEASAIL